MCFNPRTRTGCDGVTAASTDDDLAFQPTHPHGVRPNQLAIVSLSNQFQPTHPHGVRPNFRKFLNPADKVSTHAPARGATS